MKTLTLAILLFISVSVLYAKPQYTASKAIPTDTVLSYPIGDYMAYEQFIKDTGANLPPPVDYPTVAVYYSPCWTYASTIVFD